MPGLPEMARFHPNLMCIFRMANHMGVLVKTRCMRKSVNTKLQDNLRLTTSSLRRAAVVIWSSDPQGQEEHELWESVTRFLGRQTPQRSTQMEELLNDINEVCR